MKKPLDILGFQGDQKGTLGRKGLKEVSKTIHWKIIWERIKDNKRTSFKTKQNKTIWQIESLPLLNALEHC